jgi:cell division septal protein FtsQ
METINEKNFFRPKQRRDHSGGERFQRFLRKAVRTALHVLLLILFVLAGHRVYTYLLEAPKFQVREVEVEGSRKIPKQALLSLVPMEEMSNLFTARLKKIAQRFESHPWIEHVRVRKVFPDRICIEVEERKPIAILQLDQHYYIDSQGVIFSAAGEGDGYDYPFLTGLDRRFMENEEEAAKHLIMKALELLKMTEREGNHPLKDISEIHMEKRYGIKCFTQDGGLEIGIGWDDFSEKLNRLSFVWSDLQKRGLSAATIDCSDSRRMVVRKAARGLDSGRR